MKYMKILSMLVILGIGLYVGGISGICIWTPTPGLILITFTGIGLIAVAGVALIQKTHREEIKRIDKKFYEECQKINNSWGDK